MKSFLILSSFMFIICFKLSKQQDFDVSEPNEYLFEDENGKLYFQEAIRSRGSFFSSDNETILYIYTKSNPDVGFKIKIDTLDDIKECPVFNKMRDNIFIIHGYLSDCKSDLFKSIKNAIFKVQLDLNVFCVDWSGSARSVWYPNSVKAVKVVGDSVGNFVDNMMEAYNLSSSKFKFVGHSLGAHVAGRTGFIMKEKPDYIVGMDPAGPNFRKKPSEERLDITDADFVQVIHTNGALYGMLNPIGHADYYPNSGYRQPGCFLNVCSHSRSWEYFAESIEKGGFKAKLCSNFHWYKEGMCYRNEESYMGSYYIDKTAAGDYYLTTNTNYPFSQA